MSKKYASPTLLFLVLMSLFLSSCDDGPTVIDTTATFIRGRLVIHGQSELNEFARLERVEGDLFISNVFDLSPLENLTEVSGTLTIWSSTLHDLSQLESLEIVRNLDLSSNQYMTSVGPFASLSMVSEVSITACPRIASIEGFQARNVRISSLESLEWFRNMGILSTLHISNCQSLTSDGLSGLELLSADADIYISLAQLPLVTDVEWLRQTPVLGELDLTGLSGLTDITGLTGLTGLELLSLSSCGSLMSLTGLDSLPQLRRLGIKSMSGIESLSGLGNHLPNLQWLTVTECSGLTALAGMSETGTDVNLVISENDALVSLDGLAGLAGVTFITLSENQAMNSLVGISDMEDLKTLSLRGNDLIESTEGLSDLPELELLDCVEMDGLTEILLPGNPQYFHSLRIAYCNALQSLDGLSGLSDIYSLIIQDVPMLTHMDELSSLESLSRLTIRDNSGLSQCLVDDFAARFELITYYAYNNIPCEE